MTDEDRTDRTRALVGKALARLETDCSETWPRCPKLSILCDCRLRALHAIRAVREADRENP